MRLNTCFFVCLKSDEAIKRDSELEYENLKFFIHGDCKEKENGANCYQFGKCFNKKCYNINIKYFIKSTNRYIRREKMNNRIKLGLKLFAKATEFFVVKYPKA